MIVVVQAHPYLDRSPANRALARAILGLDRVEVRSLYDLYPDFAIDVEAEKRALAAAAVVVWQHPLYWYTAPALMKLWFEKVLTSGWGRTEPAAKRCAESVACGSSPRAATSATTRRGGCTWSRSMCSCR